MKKVFILAVRQNLKNCETGNNSTATPSGASIRTNSKKHYYIVSLRNVGHWSTDFKAGLYISRILRAVSQDEAVGQLCAYVKAKYPNHSIVAKDIACNTFNYINPNLE